VRQPILYATEMWKRQRFWAALLVVVGVVMSAYSLYLGHGKLNTRDLNSGWIWLLYIPSGALLAGGLLFYRWRSYVEAGEAALKVSNLLSAVSVDYDLVRGVRVQPLKTAFEASSRRRYRTPITKPYEEKAALFIRLRKDDPQTLAIVRKLGPRLAFEDTIALPIGDPDAMSWEITGRLPERLGQNLGGRRRRKRR
jgi:hypothetical protein